MPPPLGECDVCQRTMPVVMGLDGWICARCRHPVPYQTVEAPAWP